MAELSDLQVACFDLEEKLLEADNAEDKTKIIHAHLDKVTTVKYKVPNFPEGLEWMNIGTPLSWETNLQGKVVVLDFFTYCCVNCMHVLPDLEELEKYYTIENGAVIVGVHSAKFDTEKISANIRNAILRYNITHPVVNDESAVLWEKLQIQCWPTFVVVGPDGIVLNMYIGEGHREKLIRFVGETLKYYSQKDQILHHSLKIELEKNKEVERVLSFPGKICCRSDGEMIAVTDSGHNRVLVLSKEGNVKHCFGSKDSGFRDGTASECRFNSPQGVTFSDSDTLYVADTENHAVRKISLLSETVVTVVGTGVQGSDKEGGRVGTEQEISSPWDVVCGRSPGSEEDDTLYIAMAGTHQVWAYFLKDVTWYKKSGNDENRNNSYPDEAAFAQPSGLALCTHPDLNMISIYRVFKAGVCIRFARSGNEENRNNSYPDKAAFANPLGLALCTQPDLNMISIYTVFNAGDCIRFAGSGNEENRNNSYPDKAAFAQPSGLTLSTHPDFNMISIYREYKAGVCIRFAGSGNEENRNNSYPDKAAFAQPSGLALSTHPDLNMMYVADSESSSVRAVQMKDGAVKAFVGAERDPKNLFAYGNKDGLGVEAKLRHPLGVALLTQNEGPLLIADTYNSQIKMADVKTKSCTTFGGDDATLPVHIKLNEPSGLCVDSLNQLLYITDTNNHTVKVVSLKDNTVRELFIQFQEATKTQTAKTFMKKDVIKGDIKENPACSVSPDVHPSVCLKIDLKDGSHINEEAPSSWIIYLDKNKDDELEILSKGSLLEYQHRENEYVIKDLNIPTIDGSTCVLYVKCKLFYCEQDSTCRMVEKVFKQELILSANAQNQALSFTLTI
ncbi:hypothetical protein FSP39_005739 [Pinctada imbricata]|uniref:Thioredoxin domain-containing protein n=1 Tax=Pinctada imbricata TaxID=66713 RepID=A0AA88Y9C4_PINIB|nr:hypothetical protein FSP39_005739 [Pinctada imbricata]